MFFPVWKMIMLSDVTSAVRNKKWWVEMHVLKCCWSVRWMKSVLCSHSTAQWCGWDSLQCKVQTELLLKWNSVLTTVYRLSPPLSLYMKWMCATCACVTAFCCVVFVCMLEYLCTYLSTYLCGVCVVFVFVSSEGKMVVLSLAIGLAEQDDFANLPDLQEAPASQENETTPEKR